jgi:ATP-binding cassette subfamily B (MDR/TAP) protein 1
MVPFTYFFRFCGTRDKLMLAAGTVAVILAGGFIPALSLFLGTLLESLGPGSTGESTYNTMRWVCKWIMVIGCGELLVGYLYYALWSHVAANITYDLRVRYVRQLLVQEIAFFEK